MLSAISHTYVNSVEPITHVQVMFSGNGTSHVFIWNISIHFDRLFMSDILTLSLELDEYEEKEINHIVHSIARIVITTINSTNVNALCRDAINRVSTTAVMVTFLESVQFDDMFFI
jgi:hypothetical protein